MLGDERIATFQTQTDDSPKTPDDDKLIYHISDHLNSSSLDLSSTGIVLQAVDYLPFGKSNTYEVTAKRAKGMKGGYTNKYQFANKQLDEESDLQYFEKRYYDNRIGRFTTEDPVYWEVGLTNRPNSYFTSPQSWNSYSYVTNNPLNLVDPTGEQESAWDYLNPFYLPSTHAPSVEDTNTPGVDRNAGLNTVTSFLPVGGGIVKSIGKGIVEAGLKITAKITEKLTEGAGKKVTGNIAKALSEKIAKQEAISNASSAKVIMGQGTNKPLADPLFKQGWQKLEYIHTTLNNQKIVVHFMRNVTTKIIKQVKIK